MTECEDEKLLKLKGTYAHQRNFTYRSYHDEGVLSSNILWHVRSGHINYDIIHILKKNDISSLPSVPRKLKQCEPCILEKHNK